jgi:hypothetical protein
MKCVLQLEPYATEYYFSNPKGAWGVLSLYMIANFGSHSYLNVIILMLDFINWGLFFAVWVALAVNISSETSYCSVSPGGGHSTSTPCQTIYAAFAFAIVAWILFTHTLTRSTQELLDQKEHEKEISSGDRNV